jgi:hypothetical protein
VVNSAKSIKEPVQQIPIHQERQPALSDIKRVDHKEKTYCAPDTQARHPRFAMTAAKICTPLMLGSAALLAMGCGCQTQNQARYQKYTYIVEPFSTVSQNDLVVYVSYTPSELAYGCYDTAGLYLRCLPVAANTVVLSYNSQQPSGTKPLHEIWAFQNNVNEITSVAEARQMETAIQNALPNMRLAQSNPRALAAGGAAYAKAEAEVQQLRLKRR